MKPVDLYVGGDLGAWAVEQVSKETVQRVISLDHDVSRKARKKGMVVEIGDANGLSFSPADVGLMVHYPRIIKPALLTRYARLYNLHPGLLPWGRGYYPIFWALWMGEPAGATLHVATEKVDAGPVIGQETVAKRNDDTGGTLFQRVRSAEKRLFKAFWPRILQREHLQETVQQGRGSYHSKQEFFQLKRNPELGNYSGRDLVRLVQCLTFPGMSGLEVELGGRTFSLSLVEPTANDRHGEETTEA